MLPAGVAAGNWFLLCNGLQARRAASAMGCRGLGGESPGTHVPKGRCQREGAKGKVPKGRCQREGAKGNVIARKRVVLGA